MDSYSLDVIKTRARKLGFKLIYLPQTSSTMDEMERHVLSEKTEQVVIITDHQTKGVGREKRVWHDIKNSSLMMTLSFQLDESKIALFADLICLQICESINKLFYLDLKVKYPNDIVKNNKKVGGIIVKNIYDNKNKYLATSVGIGINVHYSEKQLASFKTDYPAVSLDLISGKKLKRQEILLGVLEAIHFIDTELESISKNPNSYETFNIKWKAANSLLGKKIVILKNEKILKQGLVYDTRLGEGILLKTGRKKEWFSLFGTDIKVRLKI